MKEIYTQHTLSEFFEEFKKLPTSYKIEQVRHLLDNPEAKARHNVRFYFKHLKFFTMIGVVILGLAAVLIWFFQNESVYKDISPGKNPVHTNFTNPEKTRIIQISNKKSSHIKEKRHSEEMKSLDDDISSLSTGRKESYFIMPILTDKINISKAEKKGHWPSDTVISKDSLVIQLSKDELLKLGIVFKEALQLPKEEMLKLNVACKADTVIILKDTLSPNKWGCESFRNINRLKLSEGDVIPEYITPELGQLIFFARKMGLYSKCDTLLPLVLGNTGYVLWYDGTPDFFYRLPFRYQHLREVIYNLKQLKKKNPNRCHVNYFPTVSDYHIGSIKALTLPKEFFKKMGIRIEDTVFSMVYPEHGISFTKIRKRNQIYMNPHLYKKFPDFNPVFLTDETGNIEYNLYTGDSALNYSLLVPVWVDFKELIGSSGPDWRTKYIFWYYPSDKFIAALPPEVCDELKLERDNILHNRKTASASCTYFEVCKSTLQLDNFKLYPNPSNYFTTIEFDISKETEGSISLFSIGGAKLRILVPKSTFPTGHNSYQLDVSGITPGIYLISIDTNRGFKTQRLVVTQ